MSVGGQGSTFGHLGSPLGGASANPGAGMPRPPAGFQWAFVVDGLNGNAPVIDSMNNNARVVALTPIGA